MISNHICEKCEIEPICIGAGKLAPFSAEAKKYLGIDITVDRCDNFKAEDGESS